MYWMEIVKQPLLEASLPASPIFGITELHGNTSIHTVEHVTPTQWSLISYECVFWYTFFFVPDEDLIIGLDVDQTPRHHQIIKNE